ncbi:MAG: 4'-phosphopantetheinyl transferase superfamily protein [Bilifractor sp.]|nr:4'-phosphopantetheinyl transferase superfamily protein [Eubacterium sp.]MDY2836880.1 4'-phosphopantetheinyl transferase superfamily protein [Bilifractor sp.]
MPHIYYTCYTPVSASIADISQQEHLLGRQLLLRGLNDLLSSLSSDSQVYSSAPAVLPAIALTATGKPYLPDFPNVHFNITHCDGLVACAFDHHEIGLDAELPGYFPEVLIGRALSDEEKHCLITAGSDECLRQECFYRFWTLKEAYVKKSGIGVDTDLKAFSFSPEGVAEASALSRKTAETIFRIPCSDPSVLCYQTRLPYGQILSCCADKTAGEPILHPCTGKTSEDASLPPDSKKA